MPADLEQIFQAARLRRNWRGPPPAAASALSADPPAAEFATAAPSAPAPLTVIYQQLAEEISHWLGPRAVAAQFQLLQVSDLIAAALDGPPSAAAPPLDYAAWQTQLQVALDQLEDVLEALALPPR